MKKALVLGIVLLFIGTIIVSGFDTNSTIQDKKRDADERHPRYIE